MTSSLCIVIFTVCSTLCLSKDVESIDSQALSNTFGMPPYKSRALEAVESSVQASAVTPFAPNGTLVDLDYWDSVDDFTPASSDYDIFDWALTKRVAASSEENFLLSPLGLKLALAILAEAATGITQTEISSALGFDLDRKVVRKKFSSIIQSLQRKSSQYILNLGSRIYVTNTAETRQRFAAIAQEHYNTELKTVDFNNPDVAAKEINSWVSNLTQGRIPNLVSEGDISGVVALVLNTLYFKGSWRHQFAPNDTKPDIFYVTPTTQKTVPFMKVSDKFYYTESEKYDAKILRMTYLGNKFAMYIIVPNALKGLPRILTSVGNLRGEMSNLQEHTVDVILPKFKFEYTSQLDGILKEMGVRHAFENTASFPGIARGQQAPNQIRMSKVLQRSGIEVNELGSVAYSATVVSLENKFGEGTDSPVEVIANKPFMFFIQDEATRQLLFTGRVSDPSLTDGAFKLV
uniref:Setae polypeptide n=1 Tax=Ochrogaster lunifer TaxID=319761 RepID=A0AA49ES40_OCHLU|nr:setae polypeptide [Ochrogaster lunifer]